ncbi:uncharacterized protein F5Z01DRAFT_676966 [Emericellopsis atlantica]|uniref:CST complex subunit Stn1 N-terminal domain-containing protein n=1 Tax=Emericellopsis atlantica TaxID=2614577 RepID=A0A9P7ZH61_9HYPO|nr:uncharacterized protein F5Z01DRAFT_676966 [Emericellopsis atlantica]KAG9251480.1 hypothetical protein F5Z01DRAFT_676966 [Emericellopsis atlantica]
MSITTRHAIYPRCCFHLSPTHNVWCFLRAVDIWRLEQHAGFEGQDFYFHRNLPIRWARIVGVVVAVDDFTGRRVFTIDDSSGVCVEATSSYAPAPKFNLAEPSHSVAVRDKTAGAHSLNQGDGQSFKATSSSHGLPFQETEVGSVVDIKGKLALFRGEIQLKIEKMVTVKTTAQEVTLWEKRNKFRREVLHADWVLSEKEVRRCRKEAEDPGAHEPRKAQRSHKSAQRAVAVKRSLKAKSKLRREITAHSPEEA